MGAPRSEWVELGLDFKHSVLGKERKLRKETMLGNNEVDLKQKDPVCEPFQLAIEPLLYSRHCQTNGQDKRISQNSHGWTVWKVSSEHSTLVFHKYTKNTRRTG